MNVFQLLTTPASTLFGKLLSIASIIALFFIVKKISDLIIQLLCKKSNFAYIACRILKAILQVILFIYTFFLILYHAGIDVTFLYRIEHRIAALGFSGILLTFGLKDIIDDIFAGFMIVRDKNFYIGEYIRTKDWEGKIVSIDMRHTILKTDGKTIVVPNSVMYRSPITIVHDSTKQKNKVEK